MLIIQKNGSSQSAFFSPGLSLFAGAWKLWTCTGLVGGLMDFHRPQKNSQTANLEKIGLCLVSFQVKGEDDRNCFWSAPFFCRIRKLVIDSEFWLRITFQQPKCRSSFFLKSPFYMLSNCGGFLKKIRSKILPNDIKTLNMIWRRKFSKGTTFDSEHRRYLAGVILIFDELYSISYFLVP